MAEIKLTNGRVREMEAKDLPVLIRMSQEKDIRDFYLVEEIPFMEAYWQERLDYQIELRTEGGIRHLYDLPIEHQGVVKGLLTLNVNPYVYCTSRDSGPDKHQVEVSYFIGSEFRGKGIATEVINLAIPYSFNNLNAGIICGVCLKENIISQNILRKAGLEKHWEGVCQTKRAKGREVVVYGLTWEEYSRITH